MALRPGETSISVADRSQFFVSSGEGFESRLGHQVRPGNERAATLFAGKTNPERQRHAGSDGAVCFFSQIRLFAEVQAQPVSQTVGLQRVARRGRRNFVQASRRRRRRNARLYAFDQAAKSARSHFVAFCDLVRWAPQAKGLSEFGPVALVGSGRENQNRLTLFEGRIAGRPEPDFRLAGTRQEQTKILHSSAPRRALDLGRDFVFLLPGAAVFSKHGKGLFENANRLPEKSQFHVGLNSTKRIEMTPQVTPLGSFKELAQFPPLPDVELLLDGNHSQPLRLQASDFYRLAHSLGEFSHRVDCLNPGERARKRIVAARLLNHQGGVLPLWGEPPPPAAFWGR